MVRIYLLVLAFCSVARPAIAADIVECPIPTDFAFVAVPTVEPEKLVEHSEEIVINRPLDVVMAAEGRTSIEKTMHKTGSLPGVAGTHTLEGKWPQANAHRITCLTDGGHTEEQVLVNERDGNTHHFRYEVWHYTTPQARPVIYAVGDFLETDLGDGRTRIHWTYGFRLRPDQFPGYLGPVGNLLFRAFYLDARYAELMRSALSVRKADAEQMPVAQANAGAR